MIENLVRIALRIGCIDTASQNDQRYAILFCVRDNIYTIHCTRSNCRDQNCWGAIDMMHAFGHEACRIFMPRKDKVDACLLKRVDER